MTNYSTPPPGYPPQYQSGTMPPGGQRSNGWAVASLICGVLGCVPFITSLCAALFGIVGIRKSNQPQTGGKGLAIAGLVLGIIGLLGWGAFTGAGVWGFYYAKQAIFDPARQTGSAFVTSLANGDLATARTHVTGDFAEAELASLSVQLKGLGQFRDFSIGDIDVKSEDGKTFRVEASGTLQFDSGQKGFSAVLVGSKDTGIKVQDFKLR